LAFLAVGQERGSRDQGIEGSSERTDEGRSQARAEPASGQFAVGSLQSMTKREDSALVHKCSSASVRGTGFLLDELVGMTSGLALLAFLAVGQERDREIERSRDRVSGELVGFAVFRSDRAWAKARDSPSEQNQGQSLGVAQGPAKGQSPVLRDSPCFRLASRASAGNQCSSVFICGYVQPEENGREGVPPIGFGPAASSGPGWS